MLMSTVLYAQVITVYDDPVEEQLTLSSRGRPVEVHRYMYMCIVYM